ncbi:hypothetical protein [Aminobacter sp. UC22_36]|uniref:hypothetical protein n=1 Tax=Aminobacter sp. UC22_36 TaxID=3374549 RepID=UPI003757E0E1
MRRTGDDRTLTHLLDEIVTRIGCPMAKSLRPTQLEKEMASRANCAPMTMAIKKTMKLADMSANPESDSKSNAIAHPTLITVQ